MKRKMEGRLIEKREIQREKVKKEKAHYKKDRVWGEKERNTKITGNIIQSRGNKDERQMYME